jgi:hypothetical protein
LASSCSQADSTLPHESCSQAASSPPTGVWIAPGNGMLGFLTTDPYMNLSSSPTSILSVLLRCFVWKWRSLWFRLGLGSWIGLGLVCLVLTRWPRLRVVPPPSSTLFPSVKLLVVAASSSCPIECTCPNATFSVWTKITVPTGKQSDHPRGMLLVARMLASSEHWNQWHPRV